MVEDVNCPGYIQIFNLIYYPGYTEEEVGYNLSLVYGPEYSGTVVHQVRQNIVFEMRKCLFKV